MTWPSGSTSTGTSSTTGNNQSNFVTSKITTTSQSDFWGELQAAFEGASGQALGPFFEAWLNQRALPAVRIESAITRAREILHTLETKGNIKVAASDENQTPLFPLFSGHPVLDEVKQCDADNMTPLQALSAIADWKKRLKD